MIIPYTLAEEKQNYYSSQDQTGPFSLLLELLPDTAILYKTSPHHFLILSPAGVSTGLSWNITEIDQFHLIILDSDALIENVPGVLRLRHCGANSEENI